MLLYFLLPFFSTLFGCTKNENDGLGSAPQSLSVNVTQSTTNSASLSLTASAANASTYEFDFGNGDTLYAQTGSIQYQYSVSGSYTINVTAINSSGKISQNFPVTVTVEKKLLWSDEFNYTGTPDPSKWTYDIGTGDGGWGNNELEYYTNRSQNASVENGVLKINAIRESYNGSTFTSARLKTQGLFDFKYGHIDVRAKVPGGAGTWSAAWMLGSNITSVGWPACGEVDIMEYIGKEPNKAWGTFHYPGHSGSTADGATLMIQNAETDFHIYSADWTPSALSIYVDNKLIHSLNNTSSLPFNSNFFIILNLAMGGNLGGAVDANLTKATYEVDYVRVYSN